MSVTQVQTRGIANDAVTVDKIADNVIEELLSNFR